MPPPPVRVVRHSPSPSPIHQPLSLNLSLRVPVAGAPASVSTGPTNVATSIATGRIEEQYAARHRDAQAQDAQARFAYQTLSVSPLSSIPPQPQPPLRMLHLRQQHEVDQPQPEVRPQNQHHNRAEQQTGGLGQADITDDDGDKYYRYIEQALFLAYVPRLGRNSLISTVDQDVLRMILRQEYEESSRSAPSAKNRETLGDVLHRWRFQSVRLIIRLRRGEYLLRTPLHCYGDVCFEAVDASHTHVLIHGSGAGAVIHAQHGARVSLKRVSILQYVQHNGLDFVSTGSDMEASLWPCCVLAGPGSHVSTRECFLHSRAGSAAVSSGPNASLSVISSEMHGCCFAGAAAFHGGHLNVYDARAQWSQFHGFCCVGLGSTMMIASSSANDCGRHGFAAMWGGAAEVSGCSSTRNSFSGCVSYGEAASLSVRHSFFLQNRHAGCGCYHGGQAKLTSCNLDNNPDAGLHVVGPGSRATVERSNINNNRVAVFVQEDALVHIEESTISHCAESGLVARGQGVVVCLTRCLLTFNQVHGCVAEEGACLHVSECRLKDNTTSAASSCDPGSRLKITGSSVTQSGRGVYVAHGACGVAVDCSLVFNEETAVTVQDPGGRFCLYRLDFHRNFFIRTYGHTDFFEGSMLVMQRCHMARNVVAAYTTAWGTIEMSCCSVPPRGHIKCNATDYMVSDHGSIYSEEGFGLLSI